MEERKSRSQISIYILLLCCILLGTPAASSGAAGNPGAPARVAILPFSMHTPSELTYLQGGILDMLTSRLAWQGKVVVLDRTAVDQAMHGSRGDVSMQDALRIGKSLNADYVLFGSVTALGQSISIDAKMSHVKEAGEPIALYAQTKTLDEVIPKINQFAHDINQKVFARTTQSVDTSSTSESEAFSTRNPEFLIPESMGARDTISYLNPNFIEVTPEEGLRQPGLWKSQTFKEGIVGMDIGDVDGDGYIEMVTVSEKKLMVHRREAYGLKTIATYNATKMDRFLWVALADTDGDGKAEIYVSNLRRYNIPSGGTGESVKYGRDVIWDTSSFVLSMVNGKLQVIAQDLPYYLNAVELPKRGKVLLGQQKGVDATFDRDIYEMQMKGSKLTKLTALALPSRCNIFNFAKVDINNDNAEEIILIDTDNRLFVLSPSGSQIWKSRQRFGATTNYITGKIEDLRYNRIEYYYIPPPIVVSDLNKDGIPEISLNRSPDYSRFLPAGFKFYESGEIVSFSWDQLGLVENWKTREIGGMVTSIRIGDLDNDGTPELISTVVLAKDFLKLWDSQSTIFSYDLKVPASKITRSE